MAGRKYQIYHGLKNMYEVGNISRESQLAWIKDYLTEQGRRPKEAKHRPFPLKHVKLLKSRLDPPVQQVPPDRLILGLVANEPNKPTLRHPCSRYPSLEVFLYPWHPGRANISPEIYFRLAHLTDNPTPAATKLYSTTWIPCLQVLSVGA